MDALILNRDFQTQCIVDAFSSFIWTDRYFEPGDFELYFPIPNAVSEYAKEDYYIWQKYSDRLMIIEEINISTDEDGPHMTLSGRSCESLLERRVVAYRTILSGSLQDGIEKLLNDNVVSPEDSKRKIPEIRFVKSSDPRITSLTCELNLLGETLLEVIEDQCQLHDLGFKITYNETDKKLDFTLYYGEDRSYQQTKNPFVVFSPGFDNLLSSNYLKTSKELKTAAVVGGDANYEYGQEIVDIDGKPNLTGIDRREMYVDGSSVELPNPTVNEDSIRTRLEALGKSEAYIQEAINKAKEEAAAQLAPEYRQQLMAYGLIELSKTYVTEAFEGEVEANLQYKYGVDYYIGDVVQILDEYGREASSRITEVVRSHDLSGEIMTPTFTTLVGGSNVNPGE